MSGGNSCILLVPECIGTLLVVSDSPFPLATVESLVVACSFGGPSFSTARARASLTSNYFGLFDPTAPLPTVSETPVRICVC